MLPGKIFALLILYVNLLQANVSISLDNIMALCHVINEVFCCVVDVLCHI